MGAILNFSKWRKLYEAEEAEMEMSTVDGATNPYVKYKNNAQGTYAALKSILNKKDAAAFWQLSNAVGGILKTIGKLDLGDEERRAIAYGVATTLDGKKYAKTINMFQKWSETSGWESFVNLFKDEPGKAVSWDSDLNQDFKLPRLGAE